MIPNIERSKHRFRGFAFGGCAITLGTVAFLPMRSQLTSAPVALVLVVAVVGAAVLGGTLPSLVTAAVAAFILNLLFLKPFGTLKIATAEEVITFLSFVVVALIVGQLVVRLTKREQQIDESSLELAELDARLSAEVETRQLLTTEARRAETLEQIDIQRASLLRSVSHDLRTPLAAIRAVATDLRDGIQYDEGTRYELLTTVCDEVDRLDRLVANLLSMSRIEAGAFTPDRQAIDLLELVEERLRRLASLLALHEIRVDIPQDLPLLDADYSQLEQVLTNLLANAVRHSPGGSDIWITARSELTNVRIEISDRGLGVPEEASDLIFEAFRTGEGSGSTGIGLAICRAIVEAHGGAIWVERAFGGGASFVFTVPTQNNLNTIGSAG
ncbi:MAG: ATP-binding protein [Actinomycetes bacterium]